MGALAKLLKAANYMKKVGGDLYPLWRFTGSLDIVCDTIDSLANGDAGDSVRELLDKLNISEEEYEKVREELKAIADIICLEAFELDP